MVNFPASEMTFEEVIKSKSLYVDKTQYIDRMQQSGQPLLLARPRLFGKSLFVGALVAALERRRER
jgi:hypothetical protein